MRAKAIAAVLALAAIAGGSLPGGASAHAPKARSTVLKPEVTESFSAKGSHDYTLTVTISDRRGPFTGSATFRHEPGGPASWNGDLAIELPGFGHVRLAGKGTRARMCDAELCKG